VSPQQIAVGRAEGAGGLDEPALAQRERLAPHDSGVRDPARHAEYENDVEEACSEDREHRDGQHQDGECELHVTQAHQRVVGPAPVVAREQPQRDAQHTGDHDGRQADDQRHARAVEEPARDVAAQRVGAERMLDAAPGIPHGRREAIDQAVLDGIRGRQRGRQDRHQHRAADDHEPENGAVVARESDHVRRTRGSTTV
jgi:hypothetical protein